ncbi:hypothetical protein [Actinoplanes regularis]|uniref:Uncharacterized protein n=1 Tax=Actinoplanes regularis TaxID=52697 RepID=A0A239F5V8_9ACTN|nr:hypothetical protein [Actinoplanes regularis]GIE89988.1 hypothetical protein Are01nite_64680 [Actinoplanes regularis]SNS52195.1 hypothetical protein SAMN06264365_11799 [Actinoplanes regularis]
MPEENRRLNAISTAVTIIGAAARLSRQRLMRATRPAASIVDSRAEVERVEVERAEVERVEVERAEVERVQVERVQVDSVGRCWCDHADSTGDSDFALFNTRSLFRM